MEKLYQARPKISSLWENRLKRSYTNPDPGFHHDPIKKPKTSRENWLTYKKREEKINLLFQLVYLNGGEVVVEELIEGLVLLQQTLADLAVLEAALDLGPVFAVVDPLLKPVGVVPETVLLETLAGDGLTGALVRDDEGEDGEAEEKDDEEEHDEEIDPEEPRDAAAGADEPRERDDHQEHADGYHRPLEELLAVGAPPRRQPYPAAEDRDRQEERHKVEDPDQVVAQPKHLLDSFFTLLLNPPRRTRTQRVAGRGVEREREGWGERVTQRRGINR